MTENALKCKYNGGGIPVGYIIDNEQHYQIDPLTAPAVLEAFKMYDKGATLTAVAKWMNDKGIYSYRNKLMRTDCVLRLLNKRHER